MSIPRITNLYRNAYSGLTPSMWWLSVVMLINRSGTMVIPFMSLYLTQALHYSIARAGIVISVCGLGAICGGMIGGRLTDKLGFYNVQIFALIFGGLLFILLGQMRQFYGICTCAFVLCMINDAFRPANATAIAQYSHDTNRTRSYSLNRLATNVGWTVGAALGGFIASHNYHMLFWIDGFTNIGAAILLRIVLSPSRNSETPSRKMEANATKAPSAYRDKMYLAFIVFTIFFGGIFHQIFAVLPVYYKEVLQLSPFVYGLVMSANCIMVAIFEMALVFLLERKQQHIRYISAGTFFIAMSFAIFNIFSGVAFLIVASTLLFTLGEMLAMPFMNTFWISRTVPENRGQYAGLYTVAWSAAQILGPYAGTQVVQHYGFTTLWWVIGGVGLATTAAVTRLKFKRSDPEISVPAAE